MKTLIYIKLVFFLLFACNDSYRKMENIDKFSVKVTFVGNIDKPLPTLNFTDSCAETFKLFNYNYSLNSNSYLEIKNQIQKQDSKIRKKSSLIYVSFNKVQGYYLNKERGLLFISKLLDVTMYKNNEQLQNQLNLYLSVLKCR